jgi:hypothetical protein
MAHHEHHGVSKWAVMLTSDGQVIGDYGLQFLPRQGLDTYPVPQHNPQISCIQETDRFTPQVVDRLD